jgi:pimeloyl-ACP methyl ester carboxylesterase
MRSVADPTEPPRLVERPHGRFVAYDDVGAPDGRPVVYLHGVPDCRLSRHPDDGVAAAAGVRLLAIDRPGVGASHPAGGASLQSFAGDLAAVLDRAGAERAAVLAWSGGALPAVAAAAALGPRITAVGVAAGWVPVTAVTDHALRAGASADRLGLFDLAREVGAEKAADIVAPLLVPVPCPLDLAREHLAESRDAVAAAEVAAVPGAAEQLAAGLAAVGAVHGLAGVAGDLRLLFEEPDVDLAEARCPVNLWYGDADPVAAPAFGRWWADVLPRATLWVLPGAGHANILLTWADRLAMLAASVPR